MSRSHLQSVLRPSATWIVVVAMGAAMLAIPVAQSVEAATPKCFGKPATIVGTSGRDILKGTRRADVIVAKGGNDTIVGRGGNDLICSGAGADDIRAGGGRDKVSGGSGKDAIAGGYGLDLLLGQGAADVIHGGTGNDRIDGGLGVDACYQDAGTGVLRNCENTETPDPPKPPAAKADLAVSVKSPRRVRSGDVTFTVKVTNHGPDPASYSLQLTKSMRRAVCSWTDPVDATPAPELASGASETTQLHLSCTKTHNGASVQLKANVSTDVIDPLADNNVASAKTNLKR